MTLDLRAHLQSTLGDAYVLERELGGGGMSRVFVVDDAALRRRIVVKVLPLELVAEVSLARFQREIGLAARLQHPHIVPLLAFGETQGLPYYTMPFVEGESLRQRLSRVGELPIADAARMLREIATALAYAHDKGVVHRDIKPENILLSGDIALVTDFGVAKALIDSATSDHSGLTATGITVGTPAYMAPEQISADPSADHRVDLYALGMLGYEMLTGQSPFAGRTAQSLLAAHVTEVPESVQRRRPGVPPALAALVMRCLEKRPSDRPQQAGDIVRELDALTTPTHTVVKARVVSTSVSRVGLIAVALLVLVTAGGVWWRLGRGAPAAVVAPARLLIAPFENLTGDPRFDHIGRLAADRIAQDLAQAGSVDVVPSNIVFMSLRDTTGGEAERLRRLSDATHAGLVVSGTVLRRGDSLTLQAHTTDLRTGKIVIPLDPVTGSSADMIAAADALADHLLGALGSRQLRFVPEGSRAPKYAAYQEFEKGFDRFVLQGDVIGSRPFFERAIAIDSNYTGAYQLLARQYLNAGEFARAESLAHRIERLPQGLNAVERLALDYKLAELNGDIPAQLRTEQQLAARDSSPLALSLIGEAATWLLRGDLAVPALEASGPTILLMGGGVARNRARLLLDAYHVAGLHDRELRASLEARAMFPDALGVAYGNQLRAYAGLHQPALALAVADTMLRAVSDSSGRMLTRIATGAQEFRAHGDSVTGSRLFASARQWIIAHPVAAPSSSRGFVEGLILLGSGMPDNAASRFGSIARDSTQLDAAGYFAMAALSRGDRTRARAIADSLGSLRRPWIFGRHTFWKAAILGALGDRDVAVQLLQEAHRAGQPMHTWHATSALDALRGYPAFEALIQPRR